MIDKWLMNKTIHVRIFGTNKLALTHLKVRLPTNSLLTKHIYNHFTICKPMSSDLFKDVIFKACVLCIKSIWQ